VLSSKVIDVVGNAWNVPEIASCKRVDSFSSEVYLLHIEDGCIFYLKLRPSYEVVERESDLLMWLSSEGLPTAPPVMTRWGEPFAQTSDGVYALYRELPGAVTDDHYGLGCIERAFSYGAGIARLHSAMAYYPKPGIFHRFDIAAEVTSSVKDAVRLHCTELRSRALSETIEYTADYLDCHKHSMPTHLIHRDIHPANMLMADDTVTGYLDFDIACVGPRIFDPCYCLTSMLISQFHDMERRNCWPLLLSSLLSGYHSVLPLEEAERRSALPILLAIELIFFAFSCQSGRFDAARCNEAALVWLLENRLRIEEATLTT
jgi:Ser/Thr protein kinase RdoA (MazF antagonist)